MPEGANVLIAVPTMGGIHPSLAQRLIAWGQQYRDNVSFYFSFKVAPVDRARCEIAEFFLKKRERGTPFTHLLMIDSDTIPPPDAIERLLSHDKDITTGLTPILSYKKHGYESYDNAFIARECDTTGNVVTTRIAERHTGLTEVFRCGASCLLIKREMLASLDRPFFRFVTNEDGTKHTRSEDIDFCDRARAAGFAIFADTHVVCQHYKDIML